MSGRKIIAVVGATGQQGGGLVRAILADPKGGFAVRALTRKPDSEKARELARLGAEVVAADMDDAASIRRAFAGAHGAFCVTAFWEHFSPEKEYRHAGIMAEAAKAAGVTHVIWSTLEDTREWIPITDDRMPTLMDRYSVPHFDAKGEADEHFRAADVPTTFLQTAAYWDNFIYFGWGPKRGADGVLRLTLPMSDKKLAGIAAEDIGKCALGLFKQGKEFVGKTVSIAGDFTTGAEMAARFTEALGESVRYQPLTHDEYRNLGFPGAADLGNMFQFYCDFEDVFCDRRDLALARRLNPELQTFPAWLAANARRIPID